MILLQIDMTLTKVCISDPSLIGLKSSIHAFTSFAFGSNILLSLKKSMDSIFHYVVHYMVHYGASYGPLYGAL